MVRVACCVLRGAWCVVRGAWCVCTPSQVVRVCSIIMYRESCVLCGACCVCIIIICSTGAYEVVVVATGAYEVFDCCLAGVYLAGTSACVGVWREEKGGGGGVMFNCTCAQSG